MKVLKVRDVKLPERGTWRSAGLDFFIPIDLDWNKDCKGLFKIMGLTPECVVLPPGGSIVIPSGIKAKVPEGKALVAFNKSGIATKKSLQVGACVVDEDYQGEIHIHLVNVGSEPQAITKGEKIVQFILLNVSYQGVEEVHNFGELFEEVTVRGEGKFGSTNK